MTRTDSGHLGVGSFPLVNFSLFTVCNGFFLQKSTRFFLSLTLFLGEKEEMYYSATLRELVLGGPVQGNAETLATAVVVSKKSFLFDPGVFYLLQHP